MKNVVIDKKAKYEEMVEFIYNNMVIDEPTIISFTKIVETNAKQRKLAKYKGIYEYEVAGQIVLQDENHKKNLYKKVCLPQIGGGYSNGYFTRMGID